MLFRKFKSSAEDWKKFRRLRTEVGTRPALQCIFQVFGRTCCNRWRVLRASSGTWSWRTILLRTRISIKTKSNIKISKSIGIGINWKQATGHIRQWNQRYQVHLKRVIQQIRVRHSNFPEPLDVASDGYLQPRTLVHVVEEPFYSELEFPPKPNPMELRSFNQLPTYANETKGTQFLWIAQFSKYKSPTFRFSRSFGCSQQRLHVDATSNSCRTWIVGLNQHTDPFDDPETWKLNIVALNLSRALHLVDIHKSIILFETRFFFAHLNPCNCTEQWVISMINFPTYEVRPT